MKLEWMDDAKCLGVIDDMWDESTPRPEALRFCFRCPVIADCVRYGLSANYSSDWGVLGGLGLFDRQRIRAGKATVEQLWAVRMGKLVVADLEEALVEDYVRQVTRT